MEIVVCEKYNVTCCGNCHYAKAEATFDSYDEEHYRCSAHPDKKYIKHFVFVKSDLTEIPIWCPLKEAI